MRKFLFIPVVLLVLVACATEIDTLHLTTMNSYIGVSESTLIAGMGVPDKVYKLDRGTKVVSYTKRSQRFDPAPGFDMCLGGFDNRFGYSACRGNYGGRTSLEYCDFNFNISGGKVTGWNQKGNYCPRIQ